MGASRCRCGTRQQSDGNDHEDAGTDKVGPERAGGVVTQCHDIEGWCHADREHKPEDDEGRHSDHHINVASGKRADRPQPQTVKRERIKQRDRRADAAEHGRERHAGQNQAHRVAPSRPRDPTA